MKKLPSKVDDQSFLTAAKFLEAGRDELELTLAAGDTSSLNRKIKEPIVSRPGLALTGFYEHFAWKRIQMIGKSETAYLNSLSDKVRFERIKAVVSRKAFCFVFTNGQMPRKDEIAFANKVGAVIMTTPLKTRVFARKSTFVIESILAPTTSIYGTMVEVAGLGVLIEGDPGLGKSETALGLIKRGCALIADDLTCIRKEVGNNLLFGSASDSTAGYMEIRGIGIMHIPSLFGVAAMRGEKRLQLIISFKRLDEVKSEIDRIGQTRQFKNILGVDIPNVIIPVSAGRDLVNLVETAAMQQRLLSSGLDPVSSLSERLHARAERESKDSLIKRKGN